MAGLMQLIDIAASGLSAAQTGIETVSNNTANVNTPGYNVESIAQIDLAGIGDPVGRGTDVTSIQRAFSQFAFQQVVAASSANQASQTLQTNAAALAGIFPVASGGSGGLGAAISSFFAAANTLAQAPTSTPDRTALLHEAQSLTGTFHSVAGQVATALTSINGQLGEAVTQINSLAQQIAALNQSIAQEPPGASSNALLDQRDQLVQQLGQQIGVTVLPGANGVLDVYTTGGAALVDGTSAARLAVTSGGYGDGTLAIAYQPTGQGLAGLSGGTLGGLLASQAQLLGARDTIGGLAAGLAAAVNTQQSLGLDQNGKLGQPLFSLAGPGVYAASGNLGTGTLSAAITAPAQFVPGDFILTKTAGGFEATNTATGQTSALGAGPSLSLDGMTIAVSGSVATGDSFKLEPTATAAQTLALTTTSDPAAIAAAAAYVVTAGAAGAGGTITDNNQGNVQATVGGPVAGSTLPAGTVSVPASAFGQSLAITFTSATNFAVKTSGGTVLASGSISPSAGAEIAIAFPSPPAPGGEVESVALSAGTAAAGDTFTLTPGGAGSNANITATAALAAQKLVSGQSLGDAYAALVTTVGSNGQDAQIAATAAQGVLTRAQQAQQSISGVNLDEEAAHLVAYQQAYQAATQVIATAQTVFQNLLTAVQA